VRFYTTAMNHCGRTLGLLPTKSPSNTVSWLTLAHSFKKNPLTLRQTSYNMNPGQTSGVQLGSGATRAARLSELQLGSRSTQGVHLAARRGSGGLLAGSLQVGVI
jgi:hypothetical protein